MDPTTPILAGLVALAATSLATRRRRRRLVARLGLSNTTRVVRAPDLLASRVRDADLPVDPDQFLALWIAASLLALASVVVLGEIGLVTLAVSATGPIGLLAVTRQRRALRRRAELVVFADAAASAVRGGASLPSALAAARMSLQGPLGPEITERARLIDAGLTVTDAFAGWATDPDPDVRLTGRAISMVAEHGGRAGEALERTATVLRSRVDLRREQAGMATQARSSAMVMTVAPVAFAVVSGIADPSTFHFLVATPVGIACLACGIALDVAGGRWMASIVAKAT